MIWEFAIYSQDRLVQYSVHQNAIHILDAPVPPLCLVSFEPYDIAKKFYDRYPFCISKTTKALPTEKPQVREYSQMSEPRGDSQMTEPAKGPLICFETDIFYYQPQGSLGEISLAHKIRDLFRDKFDQRDCIREIRGYDITGKHVMSRRYFTGVGWKPGYVLMLILWSRGGCDIVLHYTT